MRTKKSSNTDLTGLDWAIQTIQELHPQEEGLFTRWLKTGDDNQLKASADFAHVVLRVQTFQRDLDKALPDWVSAEQRQSIDALLRGDYASQLGVISGNLAIFWLDAPRGTSNGRLMLLGLELIASVVGELYPQAGLTPSELRTLVLLTMGHTLREAAALDAVGYETKRSQLKAVFLKTDTSSQSEITAVLLSHIIINFCSETYREESDDAHENFYSYIRDCLPASTRHHILLDENGVQTRFLDFGPVEGKPIIFVHHMGILYFSDEEVRLLEEKNLRFICPLRNGALAAKDEPLVLESHMQHAIGGIRQAQRMFCGEGTTLVCPLSSCFYGLEYLRKHSDAVSHIVFVGATYKGAEQQTAASRFRNYFFGIAMKNAWLLNRLIQYLIQQSEQKESFKDMFEKAYSDSPRDLEILEKEFTEPALSYAFQYRLRNSLGSIQHDLYHQAEQNWSNLSGVSTHFHFIHGEEDRVYPIDGVRKFARDSNKATVYPVADAGSFIYHHHMTGVFEQIEEITGA